MNARPVIIGEKYRAALEAPLLSLGLAPLFLPDNPCVDRRLSGHADLSVFYSGSGELFLAPYLQHSDFFEKCAAIGVTTCFLDLIQSEKYPADAQMNICIIGEHFVYNPKVSDKRIVDALMEKGLSAIPVKQGYAKCSVCPTGKSSLITSDAGIAKACAKQGMDVLQISPGFVALDGFEYGFIGGSAFMPDSKTLAFTGLIDSHPDCDRVIDHLEKLELNPVFLTQRPVFDIGSFVIL